MTPRTGLSPTVEQLASSASRNVVLFYDDYPTRGDPEFQITREIARPLVAHLDQLGNPTDWMFDSFIFYSGFLEYRQKPTQTYIDSWIEYLFSGLQITNLDQTVAAAKVALNQPNYRMNVFLSIPVAYDAVTEASILSNVDNLLSRWGTLNPANLNLVGFYWGFTENLGAVPATEPIIPKIASYLHSKGYKLLMIPFRGAGVTDLHAIGFDYVTIQPNYAWNQTGDLSCFAEINAAIVAGFADGSEFELGLSDIACCGGDWRVNVQIYFDQAYKYDWDNATLETYYHGSTISQMARNSNPDYRHAYETIYQFILKSRGANLSSQQPTPGGYAPLTILLMFVLPLATVAGVGWVALTAKRKTKLYLYGGYYDCQRHNTPLHYNKTFGSTVRTVQDV